MVSSSDDNANGNVEQPAASQNIPIPDCPTPDSVHSGTDSVSACSFPTHSPIIPSIADNTTGISSVSPVSTFSSDSAYTWRNHNNQTSANIPTNSNISSKPPPLILMNTPSDKYASPLFDAVLSNANSSQYLATANTNIASPYGLDNGEHTSSKASLKSKGKRLYNKWVHAILFNTCYVCFCHFFILSPNSVRSSNAAYTWKDCNDPTSFNIPGILFNSSIRSIPPPLILITWPAEQYVSPLYKTILSEPMSSQYLDTANSTIASSYGPGNSLNALLKASSMLKGKWRYNQ